jgi:hypothetical protein
MEKVPSFDVYVPAYRVEIQGKPLSPLAIISVSVDENLEAPGRFDLTLNEGLDPKTQRFAWLDNPDLNPGNEVEIYFGYAGKGSYILLTGTIKALSPSFPSTGIPSLTVEGYDLSHIMEKRMSQVKDKDVEYSDIAKQMAALYSLSPDGVEDSVEKQKKVEREEGEKDYNFVRRLAGEIGFEFFVREKTLYFREPKEKEIIKTFQFRKNFISFSPRLSMATLVLEVTVSGWNTQTKKSFKESIKLKDICSGSDLKLLTKLIDASEGSEPKPIENKTVNSEVEAKAIGKVELMKANNKFIQGPLECIGDPELRPGSSVKIEGLGELFSGSYYITSAKHTFDESGYKTTLGLRRSIT